jgi:hypothetical protein
MELWINGEKIDIEIEIEKNVYEAIQSLSGILAKDSLVISSIEIGGNLYSVDDESLKLIPVDTLSPVKVEALTRQELVTSLLSEAKGILNNIIHDIRANGLANSAKFIELFRWIIETVKLINQNAAFRLVEARLIVSTIQQLIDYLDADHRDDQKAESLIGIILNIVEYIEAIELKTSSEFSISKADLDVALTDGLALLPEISADFQTGKDKEALGKINRVISVLEFCCLYIQKNLGGFSKEDHDDINELYNDMNALLGEVVEAFENGDVVLIGDLLEYELPGKLENYRSIVLEDQ